MCLAWLKISMMHAAVVLWIVSAVIYVGRGDPQPCRAQGATEESYNRLSLVTSANKDFAFSLYRELVNSDSQGKNIFFSPVCVSVILAAFSVGARGETHQQIFDGLAFSNFNLSQTDVNQGFCRIVRSKQAEEVNSADTAVFVDHLFNPLPEFLEVLKHFYCTEGFTVDFKTQDSINTINKYVSDETNGKIKEVVDSLSPNTVLFLLSFIYYKGNWVTAFNPALTKMDEFHVAENETVSVQMMKTEESFYLYDEAINTSVLHLPFNNSYSMLLLMPDDMRTLENIISPAHVTEWLRVGKSSFFSMFGYCNIYIPKFSIKTSYLLNDVLKKMGMTDMFVDADLSGISKLHDLAVSKVVHRAVLDVDEAGATAAATTGVAINETSCLKPDLKYDRPFILMIIERSTEIILFIGKVVNPSLLKEVVSS
ncbi:serpin A3-5 [Austrofundulus limnaeus]|uniref:Thyroxine-binding globulin n=1 Tax=Austrofundulus limnaeus TaxID=52670 RepID=A0A2I4CAY4_AUSLI|nr:PREDICTED: serpin A3-5-like [Austrofundulus limnaeus]